MKANLLFFLLKCSLCPIYKIFWLLQGCRLSHIFSPRSGIGFTYLGFPISLIVHFKLLFFFSHDIRYKSHFFPYWYPVLVPSVEKSYFPPLNCLAPLSKIVWLYIYVCVCIYRERERKNLFLFHYLYVCPYVSNKFSWLLWLFNSLKIRCVYALKLCFSCPNIVFWLL